MSDKTTHNFRDSIATVDSNGKRAWIYAKSPKGKFWVKRQFFGYTLLILFFGLPHILIGGNQFFLLDILNRKFILFGVLFVPQDFYLFYLMTVSFIVFIVLFTVLFGRLFCGWACPQTLFLELIFRRIEQLIEGKASERKRADEETANVQKMIKKLIKYLLFFGVSFLISFTIFSYFVGSQKVIGVLLKPELHYGAIVVFVFSLVILFIYSRFREQVCTLMCPYGRLQGVLIDSNTIQVSYDYFRGEPRSIKKSSETTEKRGDCIDCKECVKVCPTGIDIRNGSQLECVNCTACMDACNAVMLKTKRPTGLIRYSSENGLKTGKSFKLTPRNTAYTVVLTGILIFFSILFATRSEVETTILRARNVDFNVNSNNEVTNLYTIDMVNKTNTELQTQIKLLGPKGRVEIFGSNLKMTSGGISKASMLVFIEKNQLNSANTRIKLGIFAGNRLLESVETNFLGPQQ